MIKLDSLNLLHNKIGNYRVDKKYLYYPRIYKYSKLDKFRIWEYIVSKLIKQSYNNYKWVEIGFLIDIKNNKDYINDINILLNTYNNKIVKLIYYKLSNKIIVEGLLNIESISNIMINNDILIDGTQNIIGRIIEMR